jgi:hypothetical protein
MKYRYTIVFFFIMVALSAIALSVSATTISERLVGRILLQVEQNGEAWYVHPVSRQRHYLGRPADAFRIMREQGLGISNGDMTRLFGQFTPNTIAALAPRDGTLFTRLAGRIVLQVEQHGEAYYLDPIGRRGYYLGRPADAFRIMREQGLGITTPSLAQITEARQTGSVITRVVPRASGSSCDTDDGFAIYTAGVVTSLKSGAPQAFSDTCVDSRHLRENFCSSRDAGGSTKLVTCPGACVDGACVADPVAERRYCRPLDGGSALQSDADSNINVVVVGVGYPMTADELMTEIRDPIRSAFFGETLWQEHEGAFRFWYVDKQFLLDSGGNVSDDAFVYSEYCRLNNKVVLMMMNSAFRSNASLAHDNARSIPRFITLSAPYEAANVGSVLPSVTLHAPTVLHEFGHAFGGLRDEYSEGSAVVPQSLNVSPWLNCYSRGRGTTHDQCRADAPWSDMIGQFSGVGCYEGCGLYARDAYRPTEHGLMRDLQGSYGAVNERALCCALLDATGSATGSCTSYNAAPFNLIDHCAGG